MSTPENNSTHAQKSDAPATGRIAERAAARRTASSSSENFANSGTETQPRSRKNKGIGAIIVAVYGIFALSSSARAGYQILTKFEEAPLAYSLSAVAAVVYIVATIALGSSSLRSWRISQIAVLVELIGVLVVGALSYIIPEHFAHPAVWSHFGQGYAYIPLVLPLVGLWWLHRTKPVALKK